MILRRLIPLTTLFVFLSVLPVGQISLFAQTQSSESRPFGPSPVVIAKKAKQISRVSSPLRVENVRYHTHKKYTRVVLDLPARTTLRELKNTKRNRVTIELAKSRLSTRALRKIQSREFPKSITIKEGAGQTVKVTLDLTALHKYTVLTLRRPNRVVVDLFYSKKKQVTATRKTPSLADQHNTPSSASLTVKTKRLSDSPQAKKKNILQKLKPAATSPLKKKTIAKQVTPTSKPASPSKGKAAATSKPFPSRSPVFTAKHIKDLVVVIDPGHGGKDPGAIGKKGTKEKHITLKIGYYLKDLIQKRLGSTVFLTRNKDTFLDLEKRVAFANKKKADIFISIHVNSHPQKTIKGLEVYHFGKASDPRALEVAARENGMKLEDNAPAWQFIIADKLNDQKIEQSQTFAWTTNKTLVKTLQASYTVKDHGVKTAPFYVLRFTTMPSILAEVAFVSNPEEEKRLRSKAFQRKLAEGMYKGIQSYFKTAFPTLS